MSVRIFLSPAYENSDKDVSCGFCTSIRHKIMALGFLVVLSNIYWVLSCDPQVSFCLQSFFFFSPSCIARLL